MGSNSNLSHDKNNNRKNIFPNFSYYFSWWKNCGNCPCKFFGNPKLVHGAYSCQHPSDPEKLVLKKGARYLGAEWLLSPLQFWTFCQFCWCEIDVHWTPQNHPLEPKLFSSWIFLVFFLNVKKLFWSPKSKRTWVIINRMRMKINYYVNSSFGPRSVARRSNVRQWA